MMLFHTTVELPTACTAIYPDTPLLLIGSCFSDEIGGLLAMNKLNVLANPFGVLFNPLSIFDILGKAILQQTIDNQLFVKRKEVWLHFGLHSDFSELDKDVLAHKIQTQLAQVHHFLTQKQDTIYLFITFGTAWVYRHRATGQLVANCHKIPAQAFSKELLSVATIVENYQKLAEILPKNIKTVLTVSPVRHTKDTLPLNSVSKAVLRLACHEIVEKCPNVLYFPAYEIVTDELRDYRFYAKDLIHPNEQAIAYVFKQFEKVFFAPETQQFVTQWGQLRQQLAHQSFHPTTTEHQQFLKNLLQKLTTLQKEYPHKDFSAEITRVKNQILF
jgi:lysophospholipase L1-like esterase